MRIPKELVNWQTKPGEQIKVKSPHVKPTYGGPRKFKSKIKSHPRSLIGVHPIPEMELESSSQDMLAWAMDITSRIPVHKRSPLHFLVDGLQVWVSYLDENENGPFGVRFAWMEHEHSVSPQKHITDDGGYSYRKYENFLMPKDGMMDMRTSEFEADPEKLERLNRIWVEYQKKLGETIFSV